MKLRELKRIAQESPELQGAQLQQWLQSYLAQIGMDPNAIYQELEMASRYVDTHRDTSYSNAQMQLHSHAFFELIYCVNSCGAEYLVGPERYRLQQGDIIFVPPGVSHRPLLPENMTEPYKRYVIWLSPEFVAQYARLFPGAFPDRHTRAAMLRTAGSGWEHLGDLFRAGVRESEKEAEGWEAAVIGNTMQLLTQIRRATNEQSASPLCAEQPELLDMITTYVEENYGQPLLIGDLAKRFFVSSSTISHLFKQKLGVSFCRYVTQRRLIDAKTRIENGQRLADVAAKTGFSDYSGFYRAFRQEYGISPRQYRLLQEADARAHSEG
ncbi:MAG: helix-turn-helix transcriptional regulator [Clostridia bacterium]|nr:helix-turn-helix transcriptional regulator [Clostridia bacterium]